MRWQSCARLCPLTLSSLPSHSDTPARSLARRLRRVADEVEPPASDADRLRAFANPPDPVGFCREVLGFMPWSRQREILEAVAESGRVSTVSGHKIGKSTALAALALWFYCSFPDARVVITATTDNQVNGIIWREIRRMVRNARIKIPGVERMGLKAITGLTDPSTYSEIRGYTAKEAEAIAGISGSAILYLVDEASGVASAIFEAIEGNRAGGNAWVFLISNPTRGSGEFYDSHHSKSHQTLGGAGYYSIHVDSRESPNVTGEWRTLEEFNRVTGEWQLRTAPVPGLATPGWVEDKLSEWGEDDPRFKIRVAGLFSVAEEAKVFSAELLEQMQERHAEAVPTGRIYVGVDPAGEGRNGDKSGFSSRRGYKHLEIRARAGLSAQQHIAEVEDMILAAGWKRGDPQAVVNVESEGATGWEVYCTMRDYARKLDCMFIVHRVRTGAPAVRQPHIYHLLRDELWGNAKQWAREGGTLLEHTDLYTDLHAPEWDSDIRGRLKITQKDDLRTELGRSTDCGDAFVLCCWEPMSVRAQEAAAREVAAEAPGDLRLESFDPYAALSSFGG